MAGAERAAFAWPSPTTPSASAPRCAERGGLDGIHVGVDRQTQLVQVRVTGQVPGLLPGPWTVVDASAQRVKEA